MRRKTLDNIIGGRERIIMGKEGMQECLHTVNNLIQTYASMNKWHMPGFGSPATSSNRIWSGYGWGHGTVVRVDSFLLKDASVHF
jgi:hypothetical protein